jgi:hypothetical protein
VNVEVGKKLRLREHVGYMPEINPHHDYEKYLDRHYPLFAGQEAEVVGLSPAGEHGAGPHDQHTVVLKFEHRQLVVPPPTPAATAHAAGPPGPLPDEHRVFHPTDPDHTATEPQTARHWSCTLEQLDELFEPIDGEG